jgi:hypothetical protein
MHKNATKCNKTLSKWCVNKHGASKIIDTFEMYQQVVLGVPKLASKWKLLQQVVSGVAERVDKVAHVVDGAVDQVVLLYMA